MAKGDLLADNGGPVIAVSPGAAGTVLTSNGALALPTYQAAGGSSTDHVVMSNGANPPSPMDDGAGNFIYIPYVP